MTRLTFALSSFALSPSPPPSSSLSSPSQTLLRLTLPSFSREYISGGFSLTHSSHRLTRSILLAPSPASKHPTVRRFPARASVYSTPAIFQSHCCCCCFCPAIHLLLHPPSAQQTPLCLSARRLLVVACFGCRRSESHLLRKCFPTEVSSCSFLGHAWLDCQAMSPVSRLYAAALLPDRQTYRRTEIRVEPLHRHSSCVHALVSSDAHITQPQTPSASTHIPLLMLTLLQNRPADSPAEYPRAKS